MNTNTLPTYLHAAFDLYGCPAHVLTNPTEASEGLEQACRLGGLSVVNRLLHVYPNQAYSLSIFLSESHISLHTWPENSFCSLDVFLCRGDMAKAEASLLAFLQPQKQFKIMLSRGSSGPIPFGQWTTARGLPGYYEAYETQKTLCREKSPFQLIEVIESDRFGKILLLDKDIQLSTSDEHVYHELLVHPVMRAHPSAQKVLIIGGGDGGTLREVLRYPDVSRAVLVDIDADVIRCCRTWIPEVSRGAFDDPRVEIVHADAATLEARERFDVVIVDLTAPQGISLPAYRNLATTISSLMTEEGMLAMHSGWWWSKSDVDYPSMLLQEFDRAILKDQWIHSFACFWSFVLAWKRGPEPKAILDRICKKRSTIDTMYFRGPDYARSAFVRECGSRYQEAWATHEIVSKAEFTS